MAKIVIADDGAWPTVNKCAEILRSRGHIVVITRKQSEAIKFINEREMDLFIHSTQLLMDQYHLDAQRSKWKVMPKFNIIGDMLRESSIPAIALNVVSREDPFEFNWKSFYKNVVCIRPRIDEASADFMDCMNLVMSIEFVLYRVLSQPQGL